ncbi:MAG: aryl-sulfate sulfotransferase, partial [Candidatus Micrarchaeaceae archaeon]
HDALMMPNGDVMFLTWEKKDAAQAIAAGVNPANLDPKTHTTWSSSIIEIDPSTNKVVWQWNAWNHLVQDYDKTKANYGSVAGSPQLINANYYQYSQKPDWLHVNALSYNSQTNQVIMGVREFNEFWVIDHSTTTAQAAGHTGGNSGMGGDLLYRYGNPAAYDHGTNADRTLYLQHNDHWIPQGLTGAGDVLVFNNGDYVTGSRDYTSVEELKLPETGYTYARTSAGAYAQPEIVWTYAPTGKQSFFSSIMGNAQRLPNGDTLITDAVDGTAREVTTSDKVVWVYKDPQYYPNEYDPSGPSTNDVYRAYKYAPNYSGLAGEDLGTQAVTSTYVPGNGPASGVTNN